MRRRASVVVLAVLAAVFGGTVWIAGQQDEPVPAGVQRLGPEAGELVAAYLRRAGASLPAAHSARWALVQLDSYLTPARAAGLAQGVRISKVVLRVPLPRLQTALITRDLAGQQPVAELAGAQRSAAAERLAASRLAPDSSRQAAVAAAEAVQLQQGCACVLALLVFGDGDALHLIAMRPDARVVQAALPDTSVEDLAIAPLLPEQSDIAGPVPDDGPVPAPLTGAAG
jgi:hypothetical protein